MSESSDELDEQTLAPETVAVSRKRFGSTPSGIRRCDDAGLEIVDGLAGRASVFGFGFQPLIDAVQIGAELYAGDASGWADDRTNSTPGGSALGDAIRQFLSADSGVDPQSMLLESSADMAIERMIAIARRRSDGARFRTIAVVGSDHGRSGMGRTASGQPDLHRGLGPMMAGFAHAIPRDLDAIKSLIDERTGCVLLSPIDFGSGAVPVEAEYLRGLRDLCDEHDLLLAMDETQLVLGAAGTPLTFSSIADIQADLVAISSGLFGGLPGALVVANGRASKDTDPGATIGQLDRYPLIGAVALQTLRSMAEADLPNRSREMARSFAVELAESIANFEIVRDVQATGLTIGIQTDIESTHLIRIATERGLRLEQAGDLAIRLQLPLVITDEDKETLLSYLGETLAATEESTTETSA